MFELQQMDELEKIVAETDLKIYELSRIKEMFQGLVSDIQSLEKRFELIKRAFWASTKPPRQRMEVLTEIE